MRDAEPNVVNLLLQAGSHLEHLDADSLSEQDQQSAGPITEAEIAEFCRALEQWGAQQ